MDETARKSLSDIAQAAADALEFVDGVSFTQYKQRKMVRAAVERELITVGEAMARLKREAPEVAATLVADVRGIVAFRNRVAHGYDTLDHEVVYKVATRDLPVLRQEVLGLLELET